MCADNAYQGGIAQLVEHLLCKQGVNGSIPFISTRGKKGATERESFTARGKAKRCNVSDDEGP